MPFVPHSPPYASQVRPKLMPAEFDRTQVALQDATALAEAASLAAVPSGTMNLRGVVTPSGTNDTAAVNTALASFAAAGGGVLRIPRDNWKFTGSTGLALTGTSAPIHIEAEDGCVFDMTGSTATVGMLLGGTATSTSAALGADAAKFADSITCSLSVVAGDIIRLQSTVTTDTEENTPKGEMVEVLSTTGSVITLKSGLWDSYTAATTTVYLMVMPKVSVTGLTLLRNSNNQGIVIQAARDIVLGGLHVQGARERLIYSNFVFGGTIDNCTGTDFWYSGTGTSYGTAVGNTQDLVELGNNFRGGRHAAQHGSTTLVNRNIQIIGGTYDNLHSTGQACFDFHSNNESVKMVGVTTLNGIGSHASDFTSIGGTMRGVNRAGASFYVPRNCKHVRVLNADIETASTYNGIEWVPRNSIAGTQTVDLVEISGTMRVGGVGVYMKPATATDTGSAITRLVINADIQAGAAGATVTSVKTTSAYVAVADATFSGTYTAPGAHGMILSGDPATNYNFTRAKVFTGLNLGSALNLSVGTDVYCENVTLAGTNNAYRNTFTNTGKLHLRKTTISGFGTNAGIYASAGPTEVLIEDLVSTGNTGTALLPVRVVEGFSQTGVARSSGSVAPTSGTWAVGDIVWNTNPTTTMGWVCTVAGTPGTWLTFGYIGALDVSTLDILDATLPTGAVAQTFERNQTIGSTAPTSGRMVLSGIHLKAGQVVTTLTFGSGSTALAGGTHGWFALYSPALALLGQSADDTAIAWAANSMKSYSLASPVTITTTGWYYIGVAIVASTMPTLSSITPATSNVTVAPAAGGLSSTSLTGTAPSTAAAISSGAFPYGYVS